MTPRPCPHCGDAPQVHPHSIGYTAHCDNCYDATPDAGRNIVGIGTTPELALQDWDSWVECEVEW